MSNSKMPTIELPTVTIMLKPVEGSEPVSVNVTGYPSACNELVITPAVQLQGSDVVPTGHLVLTHALTGNLIVNLPASYEELQRLSELLSQFDWSFTDIHDGTYEADREARMNVLRDWWDAIAADLDSPAVINL